MGYYYGNASSEKVTGLYEGDSLYGEGGDDWLIGPISHCVLQTVDHRNAFSVPFQ